MAAREARRAKNGGQKIFFARLWGGGFENFARLWGGSCYCLVSWKNFGSYKGASRHYSLVNSKFSTPPPLFTSSSPFGLTPPSVHHFSLFTLFGFLMTI